MSRSPLFLAALLLTSCSSVPLHYDSSAPKKSDAVQRQQAEEAAISAAVEQVAVKKSDYVISGADLLKITLLGEKDLDREVRVSQKGTITYPLVGEVKVGGLTTADAERALAAGLKDYLRSPQVSIFIKEYGNKKVFVFGQVMKPGAVELPTETSLTVLEAISQAQGFTRIAAPDRTRVVRMVDGKSQSFTIEVSAITKRGEKDKDLTLEPNDIVFVPESMF
ncbi:MAG: polysaccharide biosynthesis/export family protein [Elusimicrobia bacterium]|nr:polysaccharide biosynthesis/export family protein [Elusimicrobiota bacterium]